jgi:uncharacterized membrane protein
MPPWQLALALLGFLAYAVLSHWLMLHAAGAAWAVAAILGPLLAVTIAAAWRARQWAVLGALLAAVAWLVRLVLQGGVVELSRLYVLQHAGIHLALGVGFALSLQGGAQGRLSLIGRIAQQVHGQLTPAMVAYTRQVTIAWVVYFFAMAAASVWLYLAGPWSAWSLLANLVTPVAIGAMFVGEHLLRYRLHPEFERVALMDAVRAYRRVGAAHEGARP